MDVTPPTLRVTIDALVLDGVGSSDPLVGQAIGRALAAPLREHGIPAHTSAALTGAVAGRIADAPSGGQQ